MPRDLIDLGLVARLTETTQHLTSRYVKRYGPDPVGRVGKAPYWNSEDLDALVTAVEQGKARNKDKPLLIVVPDEGDALQSRVQLHRDGKAEGVYLRFSDRVEVEIETLGDFVGHVGLEVQPLRELCHGDEVAVARHLADLLRDVATKDAEREDAPGA